MIWLISWAITKRYINRIYYRQSIITRDLAISRLLKYAQGEDTTDESDNVAEDENENEDDPTSNADSNSDLNLNTSDTSLLIKRRQYKQIVKGKNINNHNNTEKKKGTLE